MNKAAIKTSLAACFGASFLFMGLVAFSILLAQYNADLTPSIPWFSVPVLAVVFGITWWSERRWNIGLRAPLRAPAGPLISFAILSNLAALCVGVLEKNYHGTSYAFPAGPEGTSTLFLVTYWSVISIALSTSSEVCFRGIMQSILTRMLGLWPAIGLVVLFNTLAHPWETLHLRLLALFAILFAWAWLRHLGGSLTLCICTHIAVVMGRDLLAFSAGPGKFGQLSVSAIALIVLTGLLAAWASLLLSRSIARRQQAAVVGDQND